MRITKYDQDVEFRVQFPHGNTGLVGSNINVLLYRVLDSAGGTTTESALTTTHGVHPSGNFSFSEVGSTGIYRVHLDKTLFTIDPSNASAPVMYYGVVEETVYNATVNIPMFEINQLGNDDSQQQILDIADDLNSEVSTAFSGISPSVQTTAQALKAIYDDTSLVADAVLDEVITGSAHNTSGSIGARLYALSETWVSGGTNETLLTALHTRLGSSANTSGTATAFGLLNEILADTGTTLPATLGSPAGADLATDIANIFARIGAPAGASVSADVAAVQADTNDIQTKIGAPAGASVSADVASTHARIGAPAGASVSADVAAIQADTDDIQAKLGAPVGATFSADVAAVQADTDDIQTKIGAPAGSSVSADVASTHTRIGAPAGASVSADVAAVQADTNDIQTKIGSPSADLSTDIASNKSDLTSLLSRLGTTSSNASLGGDIFGAIKYLASQSQIIQGDGALPARAEIMFPTHILAPQGVSAKYLKLMVHNRNARNQLERPRVLGDNSTQVNAEFTASATLSMGASENGASLTVTVNSVTETWTFYAASTNPSYSSGLVSTGVGRLVYNDSAAPNVDDFMRDEAMNVLNRTSELACTFEFSDYNDPKVIVVSPHDYNHSISCSFAPAPSSNALLSGFSNSTGLAGCSQMYCRVLVDGVATTGRLFKDSAGNNGADASNANPSTIDGGLGVPAPAATYFAMLGEQNVGQFFVYYKVSAGQSENVTLEIFGKDRNKVLDASGDLVPDSYVDSTIINVHHTTVQTQSLSGMGVAF